MADDSSNLPIAPLIIAALAVGMLLWMPSPLESIRPADQAFLTDPVRTTQNIPARMWQDPLKAAEQAFSTESYSKTSRAPLEQGLSAWAASVTQLLSSGKGPTASASDRIIMLPVMVEGGPYAEASEQRLRARYAVVSALNVAGYTPEDSEHIGYFEVPWQPDAPDFSPVLLGEQRPSASWPMLKVPFEWFTPDELRHGRSLPADRVIVLWLDDGAFASEPLSRLAQLMSSFATSLDQPNTASSLKLWPKIQVKVVGPASSTTIHAMLQDPLGAGKASLPPGLASILAGGNISMYSSYATAPNELLSDSNISDNENQMVIPLTIEGAPTTSSSEIVLHRTGGTDRALADELVGELERRGVHLTDPIAPDNMALISEWDTFYGRSLPLTLDAAVQARRQGNSTYFQSALGTIEGKSGAADAGFAGYHEDEQGIFRLSYLRGIDGVGADRNAQAESSNSDKSSSAPAEGSDVSGKRKDKTSQDPPDGPAQLDYMRRIVDTLDHINRQLPAGHGLRAIGVLGSDVYDKLLVLRAVHNRFPGVIFFTTDLDNHLYEKSELPWTRNLVVASQFGQVLAPHYQGSIPPFRDTYQTALFETCLVALGRIEPADAENRHARLFEIGRFGPVDLSCPSDSADHIDPQRDPPLTVRAIFQMNGGKFIAALLALALMIPWSRALSSLVTGWWKTNRGDHLPDLSPGDGRVLLEKIARDENLWVWSLVALFLVSLLVFARVVEAGFDDGGMRGAGEPFTIIDGVSIWPSELIRLCNGFLCIYFLIHARYLLLKNKVKMAGQYGLDLGGANGAVTGEGSEQLPWEHTLISGTVGTGGWLIHHAREAAARLRRCFIWNWEGQARTAFIGSIWREYVTLGSIKPRLLRTGILSMIYLAFAAIVFASFGQAHAPYRGSWSQWVDKVAVVFDVVCITALIFFVTDAIRLCEAFSDRICNDNATWDPQTLEKFADSMHIDSEDAASWLKLKFINQRVSVVQKMIYYPAVALLLMIISRLGVLDRWDWPLSLVIIFSMNFGYALIALNVLRNTAKSARDQTVKSLDNRLLKHARDPSPAAKGRARQIALIIKGLPARLPGTMPGILQNPAINAVLIPTGGVGVVKLLEYLFVP